MNTLRSRTSLILALLSVSCAMGEAQTTNTPGPGFQRLGKIKPRSAKEIASSSWSIGGETLDRDFGVYANYKKFLGPLGAKAIRLQAGWAKCERKAAGAARSRAAVRRHPVAEFRLTALEAPAGRLGVVKAGVPDTVDHLAVGHETFSCTQPYLVTPRGAAMDLIPAKC